MEGVVLKLRTPDGREVAPQQQVVRPHGRLATPFDGSPAERHIRCACDDCGAHLLGTRSHAGGASGVCLVCGSTAIRPL
jgi:hypothetical protein